MFSILSASWGTNDSLEFIKPNTYFQEKESSISQHCHWIFVSYQFHLEGVAFLLLLIPPRLALGHLRLSPVSSSQILAVKKLPRGMNSNGQLIPMPLILQLAVAAPLHAMQKHLSHL
jgi:hypothetical protein